MTKGQLMFYGGMIGVVVFLLLAIIVWNVYEKKKARLLKEIEE